jgi:hypothetical protein
MAMAQKIQVLITDDIDGSEINDGDAGGTVSFALDGAEYEIDLTAKHQAELSAELAKYIAAARPVKSRGRQPAVPPGRSRTARRNDLDEIREWAKGRGIAVKDRGRIAAEVVRQYDEAHA